MIMIKLEMVHIFELSDSELNLYSLYDNQWRHDGGCKVVRSYRAATCKGQQFDQAE